MAYSQFFSTEEAPMVGSIYNYFFLAPKNPMALDTRAFNVSSFLSQYSGASMLTAIASGGYAELYDDEDNVTRDTELFYLLDDAGYIWTWWVYADNGSYSASLNFVETDLPDLEFPGDGKDNLYCSCLLYTSRCV